MADALSNVGTGTIVQFLRSGFTAQITGIEPYAITVQTFDVAHMGTTQPVGSQQGGHPYVASKFGALGLLTVTGLYNPQTRLPESGVFETVMITAPLVTAGDRQPYWTGSACLVTFEPLDPYDDLMTFTATWQWATEPVLTLGTPPIPAPGPPSLGTVSLVHEEHFELVGLGDLELVHQEHFDISLLGDIELVHQEGFEFGDV